MNLKKIFFSYSRIDGADFALRLAVDLKTAGFNVWIDQQDIRAGSEWDLEVEKALETCDCLLFIETEKSVASNNVLDEVYYAIKQQKRVIPIILKDSKTPFRIQRLQHIDFSKNYELGLANLLKALNSDLGVSVIEPGGGDELKKFSKPFLTKSSRLIGFIAVLLVVAFVFIYLTNRKAPFHKPDNKIVNVDETFAGYWELDDVEPSARLIRGHLKIEKVGEEKVTIQSTLQFYYHKTNDTAFLSVFNGFAGCSSCVLQNEMPLRVDDIAIGTQRYQILKTDWPGEGKAGDTVLSEGLNKSIRASVTLNFLNNNTAVIKVQRTESIPLSNEIILPPFVYTFRFIKAD